MELFGLNIISKRSQARTELQEKLAKIADLEGELNRIKSISLTDPTLARIFAGTYDQAADKLGELREPYEQIPIVFGCIRARAINLAQVPFYLYQKGTDNRIESDPLVDLFNNPNERQSRFTIWEGAVTSLDARGNGYVVLDPEEIKGVPANMFIYSPDWFKPARTKQNDEWVGWWLKRPGQERIFLEKSQVIHLKNFSLNNQILGLNPMEVAKATNTLEWDAVRYNYSFFENDGTPSTAFVAPGKLGKNQKAELHKELIKDAQGVEKSHGSVLLSGGMDVKTIGISQKDMEFLAGRRFSREEIMMIYKVPKAEVELYEDMNYATATSADRSFWKKTLIPLGRMIQEEFNRKFLYSYGVEGRFDFMAIDALNAELLEKAEAADKYVRMGYPLNTVNDRLNLGFPEVDHGDVPMTFAAPLLLDFSGGRGNAKGKEIPEGDLVGGPLDTAELAKAIRGKKWNALMQKLLPLIGRASTDVRKYFYKVRQRILDRVLKSAGDEVTKQFEELPEAEILDAFSDEELRDALEKHVLRAIEEGLISVAGTPFRLDDPIAKRILDEKIIKILEINQRAGAEVVEALRKVLSEGLAAGLGSAEIEAQIIDRLGEKMKDVQRRARTIARTEIGAAFSQARWQAVEETEPVAIRWISSRDEKVRDSHQDLDGETTPVGQSFTTINGNSIRYPHDPNAAAEEVINCRCTFEPIYEGE